MISRRMGAEGLHLFNFPAPPLLPQHLRRTLHRLELRPTIHFHVCRLSSMIRCNAFRPAALRLAIASSSSSSIALLERSLRKKRRRRDAEAEVERG